MARTLMLTKRLHWKELNDLPGFNLTDYWAFAVEYTINILAHLPLRGQTFTPFDVFTGTKNKSQLSNFHTWGCPIYVLDLRIAGGKKYPYGILVRGEACILAFLKVLHRMSLWF